MNIHANTRRFLITLTSAAALALSACGTGEADVGEPPLAGADIGGDFALTNKDGETVRWGDFQGQYRIVYFGFAYCPDICPTDMQRTAQALSQFAEQSPELAANIQPIFITIDPERDTPEVVGEFASAFSDDLLGLPGRLSKSRMPQPSFASFISAGKKARRGGYLMDHSRIVYLFGPEGEPLATLPADKSADAVVLELSKWVRANG